MDKIKIIVGYFVFLLVISSTANLFAAADLNYPETIAVLQESYNSEIIANRKYLAYAEKADTEDYSNIAYLFKTLASSEAIHARNFKKIAVDSGVELQEPAELEIEISNTKQNLKDAVNVELQEIDHKYLGCIERIKAENNKEAIQSIIYAWDAEKQHRELIQKIQSAIGLFFGKVAKKIETNHVKYYVCQICGSTTIEIPQYFCPICKNPVSEYKEVKSD